jgi:hypothetical protein
LRQLSSENRTSIATKTRFHASNKYRDPNLLRRRPCAVL